MVPQRPPASRHAEGWRLCGGRESFARRTQRPKSAVAGSGILEYRPPQEPPGLGPELCIPYGCRACSAPLAATSHGFREIIGGSPMKRPRVRRRWRVALALLLLPLLFWATI